jgi:hypothetical protein
MPPGGNRNEGGIPSFGPAGLSPVIERVTIQNATSSRAIITPQAAGIAHVVLVVEDDGRPSLTSYRRVVLSITK